MNPGESPMYGIRVRVMRTATGPEACNKIVLSVSGQQAKI